MDASDPKTLGGFVGPRYEIREQVGSGSMGVVYRAYDRETKRDVALKSLQSWDAEALLRIKREFRALADVSHRNLARLHELTVDDRGRFFTMEFVDGVEFLRWVCFEDGQGRRRTDYSRLREVLVALAHGLGAIHRAGKLHRDVKPSNVLVEPGGRVVIVDFGLVSALASERSRASRAGWFEGTLAYMSPEQVWGLEVTPASDWYSVGVLLYEALTGRRPFGMDALGQALQDRPPPTPPSELAPDTPSELEELALALLATEPAERPTGQEVLERLGTGEPAPGDAPATTPFIGRTRERLLLADAFEEIRQGVSRTLRVTGVSGIGKTELIAGFLADLEAGGRALVLRSRCHLQEIVPFKALDGIIDDLARFLARQEPDRLDGFRPQNVAALCRVFPVLARVPFREVAREPDPSRGEPHEVRRRAATALRELLLRVADRTSLVLWIDDAQWGDADSAAILRQIQRPPDEPAMQVILSYRDGDGAAFLEALAGEEGGGPAEDRSIELGPLEPDDAKSLAGRLLGEQPVEGERPAEPARWVEEIAVESGGSPFFIAELARAQTEGAGQGSRRHLAEFLQDRVRRLPEASRRLVELVSISGHPCDRGLLLEAAGLPEAARDAVVSLGHDRLLRQTGDPRSPAVEPYHDRIRDAVTAQIPSPLKRSHHRAIAGVLCAQPGADPELLVEHFAGAEEWRRAAPFAEAAAERAAAALAFQRAAGLFAKALEWGDPAPRDETRLRRLRAEALVNAGRGAEAAPEFAAAARTAEPREALALRGRAAEQLLVTGSIDEGTALLVPLMKDLGVRMPSPRLAFAGTLASIARLRFSRWAGRDRPGPFDAGARTRIDLCHSAAKGLLVVDPVRGVYFAMVALFEALALGEPSRIGRSLAMVGGVVLAPGGPVFAGFSRKLLAEAERIAASTDDAYVRASADVSLGQIGIFAGDWPAALEHSERGARRLDADCRGIAWERNVGHMGALKALEELGRIDRFDRLSRELLETAVESGDRYGEVTARLYAAFAELARSDVEGARDCAERALARWTQEGFLVQHLYALRIHAYCDLFQGNPEAAWERVETTWPEIRSSLLMRVPVPRVDFSLLRARTALRRIAGGATEPSLTRWLKKDLAALEREGRRDTPALAALLRAGLARIGGDTTTARSELDDAVAGFEESGCELLAACARHRRAGLAEGSGVGSALAREESLLRAAGLKDPQRWLDLYAPGFPSGGSAVAVNGR